MYYYRIVISILLFSVLQPAWALSPAAEMQHLLQNLRQFKASFIQKELSKRGRVLRVVKGQVAFQKPDHLRWQTQSPQAQLILADGHMVWRYDPGLAQVIIQPFKAYKNQFPLILLNDQAAKLSRYFTITRRVVPKQQLTQFYLQPRDKRIKLQWAALNFKRNRLYGLRVVDFLGKTLDVQFQQAKFNQPLASGLFKPNWPKTVEIIDQRA